MVQVFETVICVYRIKINVGLNLYKRSIFVITQTQFATQTQVT